MRKVILSKRASNKLDKLLKYLELEWSVKVQQDFIRKLDKSFDHIQKFPQSCIRTNFIKGLHKLVITKQTSVFYRYNSKTITIVTIFDNRMDPNKLKSETKSQ